MDITNTYYFRIIATTPKKHWRSKAAVRFINSVISSYRFNALEKIGGQYCQYLMNREANYMEKQLREALSQ